MSFTSQSKKEKEKRLKRGEGDEKRKRGEGRESEKVFQRDGVLINVAEDTIGGLLPVDRNVGPNDRVTHAALCCAKTRKSVNFNGMQR